MPYQPVNALLYRLVFDLLRRLVIDGQKETRREARPKLPERPARQAPPVLQRPLRPRQ